MLITSMGCDRVAVIQIGAVKSMREPEGYSITPDDRQELVKCINGSVFPVDAGFCADGDVFSFTAIFSPNTWATLKGYWQGRNRVDVIDQNNVFTANMRVVVKKYEYASKHNFWKITLELWRV